jgi:hypothetical protein
MKAVRNQPFISIVGCSLGERHLSGGDISEINLPARPTTDFINYSLIYLNLNG